jgi:hypothetical protein
VTPQHRYQELQRDLARGWNTWDVRSVLSHVLMPQALAIRLGIKHYAHGGYLAEALVGRPGEGVEQVTPGPRTLDGGFTSLEVKWSGVRLRVESAAAGDRLVLQVTTLERPSTRPPALVVNAAMLWNSAGSVSHAGDTLVASAAGRETVIRVEGVHADDRNIPVTNPYIAAVLDPAEPITITVGAWSGFGEARAHLAEARSRFGSAPSDEPGEIADAIRTCLAWDTIYDPDGRRVISPVSRVWSSGQGGWVLFCWDTYFAALLAGLTCGRELAYANLVEITRHATPEGFVPNTTNGHGFVTRDRSQPPVGSMMLLDLYRRFGDRWVVDLVFDALMRWNRWWFEHRRVGACLAWGSTPYTPIVGNEWETPANGVGERFGASLESGMDNSPAYDDIPFDASTRTLALDDVGLTSLYLADCHALRELAQVLGNAAARDELDHRISVLMPGLRSLWSHEHGIHANRRRDTGAFHPRFSPMNFLPMLVSGITSPDQRRRVIVEHLQAADRYGGEWVIPSAPRDDPAFVEQHYWRGRVWGPLNYLVWRALLASGETDAADRLAERSAALLLKEWRLHRHVHENYHADTGMGCGYRWSDAFYHWGGLLGVPRLLSAASEVT